MGKKGFDNNLDAKDEKMKSRFKKYLIQECINYSNTEWVTFIHFLEINNIKVDTALLNELAEIYIEKQLKTKKQPLEV